MQLHRRLQYRSVLAAAVAPVIAFTVEMTLSYGDARSREALTNLRSDGTAPLWLFAALATPAYAALLVRRRHPVAAYGSQWLYATLTAVLLPGLLPFAGLLVALHMAGRQTARRPAVAILLATAVPFGLSSVNAQDGRFYALIVGAMALACWSFGRHHRQTELQARHALRTRDVEAREAIRAERLSLARDLHDILANSVSAMLLQAAGARTLLRAEDEQIHRSLTVIEQTGSQAIAELHRLLGLLRTENTDPFAPGAMRELPGARNLDGVIEQFRAAGLQIEFQVDDRAAGLHRELDPSVALTVQRVIQEALTNSRKHDGPAARVLVRQGWRPDRMTLVIHSSRGPVPDHCDVPSSGHGLTGLAERVSLVGGKLVAGPVADGFQVRAELPLRGTPQPVTTGPSPS